MLGAGVRAVPPLPLNGAGFLRAPVSFGCAFGFVTTLSLHRRESGWSRTTGAQEEMAERERGTRGCESKKIEGQL